MTRVALYSHDALGLGHIRRSLAIARALSTLPQRPDVLVVTGAAEAGSLPRPPGCDVVTLPGLVKRGPDRYAARDLGLDGAELISVRSSILAGALGAFAPDLLVVDRHPSGIAGELSAALRILPAHTRVVLGLRDVVDEPGAAAREWVEHGCAAALDAWYDSVWVYGDPAVHDPTAQLDVPPRLRDQVVFTGYLAHGREAGPRAPTTPADTVLGLVGGGADGDRLALAFAAAAHLHGHPAQVVLGSQMRPEARAQVHALAAQTPSLRVHDFVPDMAGILDQAAAVVSMGGYNTACEVLDRDLRTLMVPRVWPRREQQLRSTLLETRGRVDVLDPGDLSPEALAAWVAALPRARRAAGPLDLDGLERVRSLAADLVCDARRAGGNGKDVDVAV
jgi:predicted glycosyltransferase